MKTFVLTVSRYFPKDHKRAGEPTFFVEKILAKSKVHTIRANYALWKKRIDQINEGKAILSLRYWTKSPYNYQRDGSKQQEFLRLKKGECGIQKIEFEGDKKAKIDGKYFEGHIEYIANNDGLIYIDFIEWFKSYPKQTMAIIHFTEYRY
ncbi:MAG: hypothetical protein WC451_05620 [Patescibacteria group bacterium]|jgi:hypothetical protein